MNCGIYKFENKINHMIYIGLTIDLEERYNKHHKNMKDMSHKEDFYVALRQYGWENFDYEVLETLEEYDYDKLSKLEDYYVKKYNSLKPNGYNMVPGGYNGSGIAKSKPIEQYDLDGNFITEYPSAHEAARVTDIDFSVICACARGDRRSTHGYQWKYKNSDKVIKKIQAVMYGSPVYQFSLEGEFLKKYSSLDEAAKISGIDKSAICTTCKGKTKRAGGFKWSYNENGENPIVISNKTHKKPVLQFDKNNNFIAKYESISEVNEILGINKSNIGQVCAGKRKTAGGYIWRFEEKEENI